MKYELSDITKNYKGKTLYRIKALKDFSDVKKGDLGGWVENLNSLSQEGDCWIYDEFELIGTMKISGNTKLSGRGKEQGKIEISGNATFICR